MRFVRYITISLMALLLATVTLSVSAGDALLAFEVPEYSVLVGKTVKPKVIPQGIEGKLKYEWASSDEEVATVKAGTVKGVSSGTATLICRATSVDGTSYEAQCRIVVNIPITSIKVKESTVELGPAPFFAAKLDANKHYYLHAPSITIIPENASIKDIQWTSSNKKVAELLDDGMVIGRAAGTATIKGKAMDGSGKTVSYKVSVPKCFVTSKSIVIDKDTGEKLGYVYAPTGGINVYNTKISGDSFDYVSLDDVDEMRFMQIIPLKAGNGSISFYHNGSKVATVKVKVEKSAVRDDDNYPKVTVDEIMAAKDEYIGRKVQLVGMKSSSRQLSIEEFIYPDVVVESEGRYSGVVYAYTNDDERRYFIFEHPRADLLLEDYEIIVYGTVDHFAEFTSETGLKYEVPYLVNASY